MTLACWKDGNFSSVYSDHKKKSNGSWSCCFVPLSLGEEGRAADTLQSDTRAWACALRPACLLGPVRLGPRAASR